MTADYKYENRLSQYIKYVSELLLPTLLDAYFFLNFEFFFKLPGI